MEAWSMLNSIEWQVKVRWYQVQMIRRWTYGKDYWKNQIDLLRGDNVKILEINQRFF